jgi:hypothetical protein
VLAKAFCKDSIFLHTWHSKLAANTASELGFAFVLARREQKEENHHIDIVIIVHHRKEH